MPDSTLQPRSALAGVLVSGPYGANGGCGIILGECRGYTLLAITARLGQASALSAAIEREFGVPLPAQPAHAGSEYVELIWSGPERWLAIGASTSDVAGRLSGVAGSHGFTTDLTGSRTVIRISGSRARDGMMKVVPIDLDGSVFCTGSTSLTIASAIPVQLWQTDDTPEYKIACPRSYAIALWHRLTHAFEEYGYRITE